MLLMPHGAHAFLKQSSQASTSTEGATVTASATIHTKGAWSQVIASTTSDSIGVFVIINGTAVANTATSALVDIGIGGSGSETVLIPDLEAGNASTWANGVFGHAYFFPLHSIPAGSRISARAQALIVSDVVNVGVWILSGRRVPGYWTGSRVTAYGVDSANSRGTSFTPGTSNAWGTAVQVSSSTANRIRYMQVGCGLLGDSTGTSQRLYGRVGVGATTTWIVDELPFGESTTLESMHTGPMNWLLSHMHVDIPAGSDLRFSAMVPGGVSEARSVIIYGVD